jgi:uncharacterized membrane protein YczE
MKLRSLKLPNELANKENILTTLKKIVLIIIGMAFAALGISMTYKSGIGTSPMATIIDGVRLQLNVSYGTANFLINLVFLFISFFYVRQKIHIGTLILVFTMGLYINFFVDLLSGFELSTNWSIPLNLLGTLITTIGISTIVVIDFGLGPLELMTEIIKKKIHSSYRVARLTFDGTLLFLGISLGGNYGIGTIFNLALVGILMQTIFKIFRRT